MEADGGGGGSSWVVVVPCVRVIPFKIILCALHVLLCEWGGPLFLLDVTSLSLTPPPAGKPQLVHPLLQLGSLHIYFFIIPDLVLTFNNKVFV